MRNWLLSCCLCLFASLLLAQNAMPIGQWRAHLPLQVGRYVTQSADEIIYTTGSSLIFQDKSDGAPRFMDKTDGLSEASIDLVRYSPFGEFLVVVYENSVIDILQNGQILALNQIRNFSNLTGGRAINDIFFQDANTSYLATEYGLSKVDLANSDFRFSTFTGGLNVSHVYVFEGFIYAATIEGYYRIAESAGFPEDFDQWERLSTADGFPEDYTAGPMREWQGEFYLGINDEVYRLTGSGPELFFTGEAGFPLIYLTAEGEHLLAGFGRNEGGSNGQAYYFAPTGAQGRLSTGCTGSPQYAIEDETGRIWFGDRFREFRSVPNVNESTCSTRTFNSPWSDRCWAIDIHDGEVIVTAGALSPQLSARFTRDGFYRFKDNNWTNYNDVLTPAMRGLDPDDRGDDYFDPIDVVINRNSGKIFVGSQLEGLLTLEVTEEAEIFDQFVFQNSVLEAAAGDPNRTYIGGVADDEEGNTWVSNRTADGDRVLHKIDLEDNWTSFQACGSTDVRSVVVDQSNNKWMTTADESGLIVFNEGDPMDPSDDQCRNIRTNNSNLSTNDTRSIAVDLRGDVWVGTTAGVVIFECGADPFNGENCRGNRRVVQVDGFGAFLLETETVQAIAVDGANRKWIGTTNGLFLLSPDGEEQILRFTEDNSPLFDNVIRDIAINDETGEVWIATDQGALSYQGDAVVGGRFNKANIEVFPNPVRPEYEGVITIRGLARDANVKITDVSGKLVYETRALGGQAVWDGNDYNGRRAQSGVYLIFSTSSPRLSLDNPDAAVAKVVLIN